MIERIINSYRNRFWDKVKYAKSIGVDVGKQCKFGKVDFGTEPYLISIGDHVQITCGVKFFNHGGGWIFRKSIPDFDIFGKIIIGENVYIGNNALIMPGVRIGNNVIIGSGTVVTKSVPNGKVFVGNPGKIIGDTNQLLIRLKKYNVNSKNLSPIQKRDLLLKLPDDKFLTK